MRHRVGEHICTADKRCTCSAVYDSAGRRRVGGIRLGAIYSKGVELGEELADESNLSGRETCRCCLGDTGGEGSQLRLDGGQARCISATRGSSLRRCVGAWCRRSWLRPVPAQTAPVTSFWIVGLRVKVTASPAVRAPAMLGALLVPGGGGSSCCASTARKKWLCVLAQIRDEFFTYLKDILFVASALSDHFDSR